VPVHPCSTILRSGEFVASDNAFSCPSQAGKGLQLWAGLPHTNSSSPYGKKEMLGIAELMPSAPGL